MTENPPRRCAPPLQGGDFQAASDSGARFRFYILKSMNCYLPHLLHPGPGKGSDSFPSGHATHSWAAAMVIARNPHAPGWLKVTACFVATAVSLSRWAGQKHFPSDIFVGSVLGGLIGNYVATRAGGF